MFIEFSEKNEIFELNFKILAAHEMLYFQRNALFCYTVYIDVIHFFFFKRTRVRGGGGGGWLGDGWMSGRFRVG